MLKLALLSLALLPAPDDRDDLAKAAARLAEAASYAFKIETQIEAPFAGGGAGGRQIPVVNGKYAKEAGVHGSLGDLGEFFRKGDKVFVKRGEAEWTAADSLIPGGGGGTDRPRRRGGALFQQLFKAVKTPHEELKEFAKGFKEIKKDEKKDKVGERECTVYTGDLNEDAVQGGALGKMLGQFGGAQATLSGAGKAWVDGEGNLLKYEVATRATIEIQGNSLDFSLVRTLELSGVGKTEVAVPEGVKKLLEAPPPAEPKKEGAKEF